MEPPYGSHPGGGGRHNGRPACLRSCDGQPGRGRCALGDENCPQHRDRRASIYYTLDKTCPCDESNGARTRYTEPIEITEDTYIIAYAIRDGNEDSATSHFSYTVKEENPRWWSQVLEEHAF